MWFRGGWKDWLCLVLAALLFLTALIVPLSAALASAFTQEEKELLAAKVTSNYCITDVYAVVTDENGKEIYKYAARAHINALKEVALTPEDERFADTWGEHPAKGVYNLAIVVQLYTGERPTIWTGKIKF